MLSNTAARKYERIPLIIALGLTLCHFAFIASFFEPAFSSPDAIGYYDQTRLIAQNGKTYFLMENDAQYVAPHFVSRDGEKYYSQYPPGFPAMAAVIYRLFGPEASLWLNPLMASATVLLLFLFVRMWIGGWYGLLAAAILAINPVLNEHALGWGSHTSTVFFMMLALVFIMRWTETRSPYDAALTGFWLGIIPSIRYPELILAPGFWLFMALMSRGFRNELRSYGAAIAGFALPVGLLCLRNHLAFGAFWRTGYDIGRGISFGIISFTANSYQYLRLISAEGIGLSFGIGLAGIAALCARRDTRKMGIFFASLVVPVMVLYMSYSWPAETGSLRFLTPTFPLFIVASVWLIREISRDNRTIALAVASTILSILAVQSIPVSVPAMSSTRQSNRSMVTIADSLRNYAKPGDIVLAEGQIQQYLDFLGKWKLVSTGGGMMGGGMARGRVLSADEISTDILDWMDDDTSVIVICGENELDSYKYYLGTGDFAILAEVETTTISSLTGGGLMNPAPPGGMGLGSQRRAGPGQGQMGHGGLNRSGPGLNRAAIRGLSGETQDTRIIAKWIRSE